MSKLKDTIISIAESRGFQINIVYDNLSTSPARINLRLNSELKISFKIAEYLSNIFIGRSDGCTEAVEISNINLLTPIVIDQLLSSAEASSPLRLVTKYIDSYVHTEVGLCKCLTLGNDYVSSKSGPSLSNVSEFPILASLVSSSSAFMYCPYIPLIVTTATP